MKVLVEPKLKADLSALIGRQLTPFFEDGDCANASPIQQPRKSAIDHGRTSEVFVREFKNGYFEDAKAVHVPKKKSNKPFKKSKKSSKSRSTKTMSRKKEKVQNSNFKSSKSHHPLSMSRTHFADPQWLSRPSPDSIPLPKFLADQPDGTYGLGCCDHSSDDSRSVAASDSQASSTSHCSSSSSSSSAISVRSPLTVDPLAFVPGSRPESKSEPITPRRSSPQKTVFEQLLSGDSFDELRFEGGGGHKRRRSLPPQARKQRVSPGSSRSEQLSKKTVARQNKSRTKALSDPENRKPVGEIKWSSLSLDEILSPLPKSRSLDKDSSKSQQNTATAVSPLPRSKTAPTFANNRAAPAVARRKHTAAAPSSTGQSHQNKPATVAAATAAATTTAPVVSQSAITQRQTASQRFHVSGLQLSQLTNPTAPKKQYFPPSRPLNLGCKVEAASVAAALSPNSLPALPSLTPLLHSISGKY